MLMAYRCRLQKLLVHSLAIVLATMPLDLAVTFAAATNILARVSHGITAS